MNEYVTDTHALYWHTTENPRLSPTARAVFDETDRGVHRVFVPGSALIEMVYLGERGRLSIESIARIIALVEPDDSSYVLANLDVGTVRAMSHVPRSAVPDMPDRIIVATAWQLGLPLISRDDAIRRSAVVPIIW